MGIWNTPMTGGYLIGEAGSAEPCFWCLVILVSFCLVGGANYLYFLIRDRWSDTNTDKGYAG